MITRFLVGYLVEVNVQACPLDKRILRIISNIEDQNMIDKILIHSGLGHTNRSALSKSKAHDLQVDYSDYQLPFYEDQDIEPFPDHGFV